MMMEKQLGLNRFRQKSQASHFIILAIFFILVLGIIFALNFSTIAQKKDLRSRKFPISLHKENLVSQKQQNIYIQFLNTE